MPQIINTNIASLNAQRNLNKSQTANQTALQRLSSGLRINSAKDDAAGLAISTRFNSQIRGLNVAVRNAGDGISLAQTAEGALGSMNDNLQRIRELAVQSANATNSDVDRDALQAEVDQLLAEVSRTAEETDFNGRKLLNGEFSATFQIGANAGQTLDISIAELTADKLGASSESGVSALGTSVTLGNGDLLINGQAITASKAEDDSFSTSNQSASAIAKVAAINREYENTGVKAVVNENVAAGSEMTATAGTGTITLNGVDIDITTTSDTAGTRASIAAAINAVAEQTGITAAVDDLSDATGVSLTAENGRNIELSFDTADFTGLTQANFAASTGLAGGQSLVSGTVFSATYEGGYTLIADGDVSDIVISGGNGTGNGDLANAGLTAGTYSAGTASLTTDAQNQTTVAQTQASSGSNNDSAARTDTGGTLIAGSADVVNVASAAAIGITTATEIVIDVDGVTTQVTATAAETIAAVAAQISAANTSSLSAVEEISFDITSYATATGAAGTITFTDGAANTVSVSLGAFDTIDSDGDGTLGEAIDQFGELIDKLDGLSLAALGGTPTISAEMNTAGTGVTIKILNDGTSSIQISTDTAATQLNTSLGGTGAALNSAAEFLSGQIRLTSLVAAETVEVSIAPQGAVTTGQLLSSTGFSTDTASHANAQGTANSTDITVTVGGTDVSPAALAADSTASDLAAAINGVAGVSAWEAVDFNLYKSADVATGSLNLTVGDTLSIGGTAVSITADATSATVTHLEYIQTVVDDINGTDFSGADMQVSATVSGTGTSAFAVIEVKNYSGADVSLTSAGDYRRAAIDADGDGTAETLVTSNARQVSGELQFRSDNDEDVVVTLADPSLGGELIATASESATYSGVNGLKDGDLIINGVSISGAESAFDTASATESSDKFKILSSEKGLSGISVAEAINSVSEETGVSASVNETSVVGGNGETLDGYDLTTSGPFAAGDQAGLFINGVNIGSITLQADSAGSIDADRSRADALTLINQSSGQTGVVAVDNGVSISLTAADGRNISIAIDDRSGSTESIGAVFGLDAGQDGIGESTFGDLTTTATNAVNSAESETYETTYSTIELTSAKEISVEIGSQGNDELEALGFKVGTFGGGESGQFLTEIDISTFEGATDALTAIDNAIGSIASQRAVLGAVQNRMESTVSNLAITSENLAAANSRIQDADFAAETAELSRTQVLQQAGISILAQANQGPQQVLSLLG
jgi:flagellin